MHNLFAYGTLMCEDIMQEVSGCRLRFKEGTLRGFGRRKVKGEHYPAIFPNDKDAVQGIVYLKAPPSAWLRIDRFEGAMYVRQSVQIELGNGTILPANAYVIQPAYRDFLEAIDWDLETFLRCGREAFRTQYPGYSLIGLSRQRCLNVDE